MIAPRYGRASLPDVLPSAVAALGVDGFPDPLGLRERLAGVRRIAVLLVDGLGHRLLPLAAPVAPVIADLLAGRLGTVLELTSPFPSTTPVSLVSLGTGVPPGQHGQLGFFLVVPGTGRVLDPLTWRDDPDPGRWQPVPTVFSRAAAAGVRVGVASRPEYAGSGLTVAAYRGARYRPARTGDELVTQILAGLAEAPALSYGYHPSVDQAGHQHGVDSPEWRDAVTKIDTVLARLVEGLPGDAALLVTADHGQLNVPADRRFDVGSDARLSSGVRLVAGEPRVRYVHTRPGAVADVLAAWREVLGPAATVLTRDEAVATGWYGSVLPEHLLRIGDVVAVCHDRYAILASGREPETIARLVGFHGSVTPEEMTVPLIVVRGEQ